MQTYSSHGSRRRRSQSATVRLKNTPQLRLMKLAGMIFLALIGAVILGLRFLPEEKQTHFMTAEQERACTRAYLSADTKMMESLCDPDHGRQPSQAGGNPPPVW
jgi:hypothetical protein